MEKHPKSSRARRVVAAGAACVIWVVALSATAYGCSMMRGAAPATQEDVIWNGVFIAVPSGIVLFFSSIVAPALVRRALDSSDAPPPDIQSLMSGSNSRKE